MLNAHKRIIEEFKTLKVDALLVTELKNVRYLTGFTGSNGYCLITEKKKFFFTDSRYTEQSKLEVKGFTVKIVKNALVDIGFVLTKNKVLRLGFESNSVVYSQYEQFKKAFKGIKLKPVNGVVESIRIIKDISEVALIKDAIKVANKGFNKVRSHLSKG